MSWRPHGRRGCGGGRSVAAVARSETLPIDSFLDELIRRLDTLGPDGVREALLAHARSLRPSQRQAFLEQFATANVADGTTLLAEIDRFVGDVGALQGRPWRRSHRWGHDEPAFPAESLAIEDLLVAAGERFLAGDIGTAGVAYEKLLSAVVSTIDDDRNIDFDLDADITSEARDRLLWCLAHGDGVAPGERARRIIDAIDATGVLMPMPRGDGFVRAHPDLAPVEDAVLRAVVAQIDECPTIGAGWRQRSWHELSLQLREHLDGIDAAIGFVREAQVPQLDGYRWLTDRHIELGALGTAAGLAVEALDRCRDSWDLATLADTAAELCAHLGRADAAASAAMRAWRAHPTAARLETICDLAVPDAVAAIASSPPDDRSLAATVAILAGDLVSAVNAAQRSDPGGRIGEHAATRLVVAACCHGAGPAAPHALIATTISTACRALHHDALETLRHRPPNLPDPNRIPLESRLLGALAQLTPDPARLDDARALVDAVTETVLGAKQRHHYATAAELVVLVAHTAEAINATPASETVAHFDNRYRRFPAFRTELRTAQHTANTIPT